MKQIPAKTLSDALYILKIPYEINEIFTPRRIQFLQKKYEVNIEIHIKCEEKGSEKFYLPLKQKFAKTLCIVIPKEPLTSHSIMENFQIIQDRRKLSLDYVCDVTKGCKYTTNIKANFQRHVKRCKAFNTPKVRDRHLKVPFWGGAPDRTFETFELRGQVRGRCRESGAYPCIKLFSNKKPLAKKIRCGWK